MNIYNALIYKKLYGGGGGGEIEVESLTATENKTYNAGEGKAYNPVVVAIPEPTLISKNITANGNYSASTDNADGYSSVSVNVPLPSNAYLLKSIEHEQVATFSDGTDNFIKSLEVAIEPVQSGSGDPSPTNIRPISGWDECKVTRCGVNVWDEETEFGYYDVRDGGFVSNVNQLCVKNFRPVKPSTTYYFHKGSATNQSEILMYDKDKNYISYLNANQCVNKSFETPSNCYFITFNLGSAYGTTYLEDISINLPNTDHDYHAYNGNTYTINFVDGSNPLTVYGGMFDVLSGVLTLTHGFISSYNGETLPSTWISDRDLYAEGTTPTIGAEVVYELATPQTIQLTPTIIKSLQGDNNFFASTGEIELLQYWGKEVTS